MNIEEALIDLGDQPLSKSPYAKTVMTLTNSLLMASGQTITLDMPGHQVLSLIYQHTDSTLQSRILHRELRAIRSTDRYRHLILGFSIVIAVLAVGLASAEVFSDAPVNDGHNQVMIELIHGMFEVLKLILGSA